MKINYDKELTEDVKNSIIRDYVENEYSIKEIIAKYNVKSKEYLCKKLLKNKIRNFSKSAKLAHKKYPQNFKHTEETKNKIRKVRLKFMEEHPEETAWRKKNMSFPEKCFKKLLEENSIDKKFLIYREYSVFPYYIDFAFIDIKVAVEIDGSQHLEEERQQNDRKKDELLTSKGWRVIRFTAFDVIKNSDVVLETLNKFIESNTVFEQVGIVRKAKKYVKKPRNESGYTEAQEKVFVQNRKVKNRPMKEILWEEVCKESFNELGRKYSVNANTIKNWCKNYGLPHTKKDIDKLIGKKHKYARKINVCKNCGKEFISEGEKLCCCETCHKQYIKEHYKEIYANNLKMRHICKMSSDNTVIRKRVSNEELEKYITMGWKQGRKI